MPHGFPSKAWNTAKEEARAVLISRARTRGMIPYSELAAQITAVRFEAHEASFWAFLGELSAEENAADRGMIFVIVVHKNGDMQPGPGFFELASSLGRDTSDILACWVDEFKKVHAYWSKH